MWRFDVLSQINLPVQYVHEIIEESTSSKFVEIASRRCSDALDEDLYSHTIILASRKQAAQRRSERGEGRNSQRVGEKDSG